MINEESFKEGKDGSGEDGGHHAKLMEGDPGTRLFVKQKRWPDWGLNPGPSRHILDALTTELSGLYQ